MSWTDRIVALLRYPWTYLVVRLDPLWWGVAAVAGVAASVGCATVLRSRGRAACPGRVLCAGLLAAYVTVVVAGTVFVRQRAAARVLLPDELIVVEAALEAALGNSQGVPQGGR